MPHKRRRLAAHRQPNKAPQKSESNNTVSFKDAVKFVKKLIDKYSSGDYIFRGTATRYSLQKGKSGVHDGINSTLYRAAMEEQEGENLQKTLADKKISFFPAYIEQMMVNDARRYFPPNADNLEILTDLQHFGGATNMIDFSCDIHVALFFACTGSVENDGEFIALNLSKAINIDRVDYTNQLKREALEVIKPTKSQSSDYRVNFQGSVFVRPADGYINPNVCEIEKIPAKSKRYVLQYLKNICNVTASNIYNDFHGFITTQKDYLRRSADTYLGLARYSSGDYKKALASFNKNISLNPDDAYTDYNNRGMVYNSLEEHELAIKDHDKAISLNPNYAEAYLYRGIAYGDMGQQVRAVEDFDKAILLKPNLAAAYFNRGAINGDLRQYEQAFQDFNKAILLKPNLAEAYSHRGRVYLDLGYPERAIQDFNKAIELNLYLAEAYNERGNAYTHLEEYELAIEDYDKVISIKPELASAYNNRGSAHSRLKQYDLAIQYFKEYLSMNPQSAEAHTNLGSVYSELKDYKTSIKYYDEAVLLDPKFAVAYYNRGLTKVKMGNKEGAESDFATAQKLGIPLPKEKK